MGLWCYLNLLPLASETLLEPTLFVGLGECVAFFDYLEIPCTCLQFCRVFHIHVHHVRSSVMEQRDKAYIFLSLFLFSRHEYQSYGLGKG